MSLQDGWTNAPFGTSNAAAANIGGIVHLEGAIANTPGMFDFLSVPFVLPVGLRPQESIYVEVDLCNAARGRLMIDPDGIVPAGPAGPIEECVTLDGASFPVASSRPLALQSGWTHAPFSRRWPRRRASRERLPS
jgi:hypothetical protein